MTWSKLHLAIVLVSLAFFSGILSDYLQANDQPGADSAPVASGAAGVVEGTIVEVDSQTLVIEKLDGDIVKIPMPGKTGETAQEFSKGDYIEAAVTPEGLTTSVRVVANPEKHEEINPKIR